MVVVGAGAMLADVEADVRISVPQQSGVVLFECVSPQPLTWRMATGPTSAVEGMGVGSGGRALFVVDLALAQGQSTRTVEISSTQGFWTFTYCDVTTLSG